MTVLVTQAQSPAADSDRDSAGLRLQTSSAAAARRDGPGFNPSHARSPPTRVAGPWHGPPADSEPGDTVRCPSPRPESGRRRPAGGGLLEVTAAADGLPDELARPLAAAQAPGLSSLSIQNDSDIIRVMSPGPLAFLARQTTVAASHGGHCRSVVRVATVTLN